MITSPGQVLIVTAGATPSYVCSRKFPSEGPKKANSSNLWRVKMFNLSAMEMQVQHQESQEHGGTTRDLQSRYLLEVQSPTYRRSRPR